MDPMTTDQSPDTSMHSQEGYQQLCDLVEHLIGITESQGKQITDLTEQVQKINSMVVDDLFGGIRKLYDGNIRSKGIDDLRGQYGDAFAPHMDAIKTLEPDGDIFEKLYDAISDMKNSNPDYNDEMADGHIQSVVKGIADMVSKLKGVAPEGSQQEESAETPEEAAVEGDKPDGAGVEVTKVSATPVSVKADNVGGADEKLMAKIKAMKEKNKASGKSGMY